MIIGYPLPDKVLWGIGHIERVEGVANKERKLNKMKTIKYKITKGYVYGVDREFNTSKLFEVVGDKKDVKLTIKDFMNNFDKTNFKNIFSEIETFNRELEISANELERIYNERTSNKFDNIEE